jgi:hypothetical protein
MTYLNPDVTEPVCLDKHQQPGTQAQSEFSMLQGWHFLDYFSVDQFERAVSVFGERGDALEFFDSHALDERWGDHR